ncbi:uncharacterized protein LOC126787579 [Argentina anserina]|uniref:uncharacterized protein LOC126787579 n=1 Tax=Argentina anserina TaxID=57926 RepID=UPI0021764426|nr:uncharacterized protein LOC126787579 [Potentilla anserina]
MPVDLKLSSGGAKREFDCRSYRRWHRGRGEVMVVVSSCPGFPSNMLGWQKNRASLGLWSNGQAFNGECEFRPRPLSLSGEEILAKINSHEYLTLSLQEKFKVPYNPNNRVCWTNKCMFWRLPYWKFIRVRYAFDVMHIERNVFDNIIGTTLSIARKSKDGPKARAALKKRGVRQSQWERSNGQLPHVPFLVRPEFLTEVFEWFRDVKYPHGYAGSLRSKVNVREKNFHGLKTHDCHVMLQRLLSIVIREYLPLNVVKPLVALCRWFQKLCARKLRKEDVRLMEAEIVMILCNLEMIFPPHFFTTMVHLMVHLPEQVLLTGPVHFTRMFPMERQLGTYKKSVNNRRYPEGCISKRYITWESVTYCNLYMEGAEPWEQKTSTNASRLTEQEVLKAHWQVLLECKEVKYYMVQHEELYTSAHPNSDEKSRRIDFHPYFLDWVADLERAGNDYLKAEVVKLARRPQGHNIYSTCYVNGVKFISYYKDRYLQTQNCGVMIETETTNYYEILEYVLELLYTDRMSVVLFKCKWYDTDPYKSDSTKLDHDLLSVDTNSSWYEDSPFCLASTARQVFYVDDPKAGEAWKVVNVMSHRNVYDARTLATHDDERPPIGNQVREPYQEPVLVYSGVFDLTVDLDWFQSTDAIIPWSVNEEEEDG